MFKSLASALALTAVLSLAAAPASAWERHHNGFGLLAAGVVGAVIGAEIASHRSYDSPRQVYRSYEAPVEEVETEVVKYCPPGTHLGRYGHYCWAN